MKQCFMLVVKLAIMCTYGNLRIFMKPERLSEIHQKWMFLVQFLKQSLGPILFCRKQWQKRVILKWCRPGFFHNIMRNDNFILYQDRALPHYIDNVWSFLNDTLPQCCIGYTGLQDITLHSWLPRSPDITTCYFFL